MSRWGGVSWKRQRSKLRGCVDNQWNRELTGKFNEIVWQRIEEIHRMMQAGNIVIISVLHCRNRDRIRCGDIHFSLDNSLTPVPKDLAMSLRMGNLCSGITISPRSMS
jgi:hypothetical protein